MHRRRLEIVAPALLRAFLPMNCGSRGALDGINTSSAS
jgi:hypothetical protein